MVFELACFSSSCAESVSAVIVMAFSILEARLLMFICVLLAVVLGSGGVCDPTAVYVAGSVLSGYVVRLYVRCFRDTVVCLLYWRGWAVWGIFVVFSFSFVFCLFTVGNT